MLIVLAMMGFHLRWRVPPRRPRNVYLDLGANRAQTLDLHERLMPPASGGWEVYSFEASPWIGWYVEQVVAAKNSGEPPPELPFPASGSSNDLRRFADKAGCNATAPTAEVRGCMLDTYREKLTDLELNPRLNDSRLISARLAEAAQPYNGNGVRYTFVPAAVTTERGWMEIRQSMLQLLIGGVVTTGRRSDWTGKMVEQDEFFPEVRVATIDLVGWLVSNFSPRDNVVVKADIEGAEHQLLRELLRRRGDRIIKVLAMECHEGKGGSCRDVDKLLAKTRINVLKEGRDYNGWK
jgi:FkbM family methyltransferase